MRKFHKWWILVLEWHIPVLFLKGITSCFRFQIKSDLKMLARRCSAYGWCISLIEIDIDGLNPFSSHFEVEVARSNKLDSLPFCPFIHPSPNKANPLACNDRTAITSYQRSSLDKQTAVAVAVISKLRDSLSFVPLFFINTLLCLLFSVFFWFLWALG